MKQQNGGKRFQSDIPCIYHLAALSRIDGEVLNLLIPLSKSLGISYEDLSLITVSLSQSDHYLSRRYSYEELMALSYGGPITCDDMINKVGSDILCHVCWYSDNYRNYNSLLEKNLLSYCFKGVTYREKVEKLLAGRPVSDLFKSYTRLGKNDVSLTYVNMNRMIFEFLQDNIASYDDLDSPENVERFIDTLVPLESNPSCYKLNGDYVKSCYLNCFKNRGKDLIKDNELETVIATLMMDRPAEVWQQQHINYVDGVLSMPLTSQEGTVPASVSIVEIMEKEQEIPVELEASDKNEIKANCDISTDITMPKTTLGLENKDLKYPEVFNLDIKKYSTIRQILSEGDAAMFDYDILKNKYICIELVKYNTCDGLLFYLPKGNVFYFCTLDNKYCKGIVSFYCNDSKVIKKLCIHSVPVIEYFDRHGSSIRNLISLQTLYNIASLDSLMVKDDQELIEKTSESKCNSRLPFLSFAMKKYVHIYEKFYMSLDDTQVNRLHKELSYERMVGLSYNLKDLSRKNNKTPHYVSFSNLHDYRFNYQAHIICSEEGFLLHANYLYPECPEANIIDAYSSICIACVESGVFDNNLIRLLQLSINDGLVFYVSEDSFKVFFSLLNRWMISSGQRFISINPLIDIRAEEVKYKKAET